MGKTLACSNTNLSITHSNPKELLNFAAKIAVDQKALDVRPIDVKGVTDIADFFLIASGTSQRHVQGIAEKIIETLKKQGEEPVSVSGLDRSDWVVIDYGDFIAHVFYEPTRQYYRLDDLWKDAKQVKLTDDIEQHARRLRTGLYLNYFEREA